jgi:hypothetical protein
MPRFVRALRYAVALALVPSMTVQPSYAWGHYGHEMINRLAIQYLPKDVPAFLRNGHAMDTVEYLGPEPDRWRNRAEAELGDAQAPEHFIDLEEAESIGTLPRKRLDYIQALAQAQPHHPELQLNPSKTGLLPYETEEVWQRLKVGMREYRHRLAAGDDTAPAETAILFYAGWLGHYVADGSQPLHVTSRYNGWTGANPNAYTVDHKIHGLFESTYVNANVKPAEIASLITATQPKLIGDEWDDFLEYLRHSGSLVEKTYQIEKSGGLTDAGSPEAKAFVEERLAAGAIELRDLIYTAWVRSADPVEEYHGAN